MAVTVVLLEVRAEGEAGDCGGVDGPGTGGQLDGGRPGGVEVVAGVGLDPLPDGPARSDGPFEDRAVLGEQGEQGGCCLLYTSPSPRD